MDEKKPFSARHGYRPTDVPIVVRDDAPHELRGALLAIAYESGASPSLLRSLVCGLLRTREDPDNWSEWPNIAGEVQGLVDRCGWYLVYDIAEAIYAALKSHGLQAQDTLRGGPGHVHFAEELNEYFHRAGIGWQLLEGRIQIRGEEAFERTVAEARGVLDLAGRATARNELHQALGDLSRRPEPDRTGAVQHAMAALECVVRDVTGNARGTLGELLKKHQGILPAPLDQVVEKAWGFASERGRHVREGREPTMEEAELIVGLAAVVSTFVSKVGP